MPWLDLWPFHPRDVCRPRNKVNSECSLISYGCCFFLQPLQRDGLAFLPHFWYHKHRAWGPCHTVTRLGPPRNQKSTSQTENTTQKSALSRKHLRAVYCPTCLSFANPIEKILEPPTAFIFSKLQLNHLKIQSEISRRRKNIIQNPRFWDKYSIWKVRIREGLD